MTSKYAMQSIDENKNNSRGKIVNTIAVVINETRYLLVEWIIADNYDWIFLAEYYLLSGSGNPIFNGTLSEVSIIKTIYVS